MCSSIQSSKQALPLERKSKVSTRFSILGLASSVTCAQLWQSRFRSNIETPKLPQIPALISLCFKWHPQSDIVMCTTSSQHQANTLKPQRYSRSKRSTQFQEHGQLTETSLCSCNKLTPIGSLQNTALYNHASSRINPQLNLVTITGVDHNL